MENWSELKLKDICKIKGGKRLPQGHSLTEEITSHPYIRARDIKNGKINIEKFEYIYESTFNKISSYIVNTNDICITIVANIGDVGIVTSDLDGASLTENAVKITIFDEEIDCLFLNYLLSSKYYKDYMNLLASGAAQAKLGIYKIENILIRVPKLKTQQQIAAILTAYDDLIETNNQRIATLEAIAQQIYKEWFVRLRFPNWEHTPFHHGIPDGWEVKYLDSVLIRKNFGKTYKPNEVFQEGKVIVIDQTKGDYLGFHNSEPDHKATIDKPIILFGDHTCKMRMMINDFSLAENVIPFTSKEISEFFILHLINGLVETTEYKRHWSELVSKSVFIPSKNLHEKFSDIVKPFYAQIKILAEQNENLTKTRNLLLPRLISGKLTLKQAEAAL